MNKTDTETRAEKYEDFVKTRIAREAEILLLRDRGLSNRAIARKLEINESSVRTILKKSEKN